MNKKLKFTPLLSSSPYMEWTKEKGLVGYDEPGIAEYFRDYCGGSLWNLMPDWNKRIDRLIAGRESFYEFFMNTYGNLAHLMSDDGMQIVTFAHKSPDIWADITSAFWHAGLKVTAVYSIQDTPPNELKKGNYLTCMVLIILRKAKDGRAITHDEVINEAVQQVNILQDIEDCTYSKADYVQAAYSGAMKILTQADKLSDCLGIMKEVRDIATRLCKTA